VDFTTPGGESDPVLCNLNGARADCVKENEVPLTVLVKLFYIISIFFIIFID